MHDFHYYFEIFTRYFTLFWRHTIVTVGAADIKIENILLSIIILYLGIKYSNKLKTKINEYIWTTYANDKHAANVLVKVANYSSKIIFIVLILEISNIPFSSFAFIGGALALGVGFGAQNLLNNFISSIILALEKPLKIGDTIEVNGIIGTVSSISARCITIITNSNVEVLVPSSKLLQNNLVNWTLNDNLVKQQIEIKISPKNDSLDLNLSFEKARKLIDKIITKDKNISKEHTPTVDLHDANHNSCNYIVTYSYDLTNQTPLTKVQSTISSAFLKELSQYDINFSIHHVKTAKLTSISEDAAT